MTKTESTKKRHNRRRNIATIWDATITNEIAATGNITAYYSDERLKEKLGDIDNALNKVNQIETFYYKENDLAKKFGFNKPDKQVGVSAQSVEKVLPEVVSLAPFDYETAEDGTVSSKSGENYKTVDYEKLVPLLIATLLVTVKE